MRKLNISLLITACLFALVFNFKMIPVYAYSQIELPIGTTASGELSDNNAEQIYKIVLPESGRLTINVSSYLENMNIELSDIDGNIITSDSIYDGKEFDPQKWSDQEDLEEGTYFIKIRQGDWGDTTGNYSITTHFEAAGNNEIEPNNGTDIAQLLDSNNQPVKGFLSWSDSEDYYKVILQESGTITVNVSSYIENIKIELSDDNGERIISDSIYDGKVNNPQKQTYEEHLEAGTYYIKISRGDWGNTTGIYQLNTKFQAAGNNEVEPNNGTDIAQLLSLDGQTVKGFLSWNDSEDYYKVILQKPRTITVNVSSYIENIEIELFDDNGERIIHDSIYGGKVNNPQKWTYEEHLEAGAYYIKISWGDWGNTTGLYTLNVQDPSIAKPPHFTDVSNRYKEAVDYLIQKGITQGLSNSKFGVQEKIKRIDAAIMIAKALKLDTQTAKNAGFTDVPKRGQGAVSVLVEKGILNGKTKTKFGANDHLTRGEMALILTRAYHLDGSGVSLSYTDVSERYQDAVKALVKNKITQGKTAKNFGTSAPITRGEMAIFLYRADTMKSY
jgi:hypothetical protein